MNSTIISAAYAAAQLDQRIGGQHFTHLTIPSNRDANGWDLASAALWRPTEHGGPLFTNLDAPVSTDPHFAEQSAARHAAAQRLKDAITHLHPNPWRTALSIPLTPPGAPVSLVKRHRPVIVLYRITDGGGREIVDSLFEPPTWEVFDAFRERCQTEGLHALWLDAVDRWDALTAAPEILAARTFNDDAFHAAI